MKFNVKTFCIHALAPLHIGCDEAYEPIGFVVNESAGYLSVFDPLDFLRTLPAGDLERLSAICKKGTPESILEIYKFMRGKSAKGRQIELSADFVAHYRQMVGAAPRHLKEALNQFAILRTSFRSRDQRPYIPGSAVKGALRTAYLNAVAAKNPSAGLGKAKEMEKRLLGGSFDQDPFRLVKVSDFAPAGKIGIKINYVINMKKNLPGAQGRGPYQILETILPGACFVGRIEVGEPPRRDAIKHPISFEALLAGCQHFYTAEKQREDRELEEIQIKPTVWSANGGRLLRLGRHSGAECMTLQPFRQIKIKQKKGGTKILDHATTLWLASEHRQPKNMSLLPMGWTLLEELSPQAEMAMEQMEQDHQASLRAADSASATAPAPRPAQTSAEPETAIWRQVHLTWSPNNSTVTATFQGLKAEGRGKNLVPEHLQGQLFGRKKRAAAAAVKVMKTGNAYTIVSIE